MKKRIFLLVVVICFILTGCNNEFAKKEYNENKKIAQTEDRYAKEYSVFNPIEGGYSFKVSKFDGRETLWSEMIENEQDIEIKFLFKMSKGHGKVVHIDADGNVTDVIECVAQNSSEEFITKTVSLKSGINRLKFVGYDCEDIDLEMLFDNPQ